MLIRTLGLSSLATLAIGSAVQASAISLGDVVVLRVGNGTTALGTTAGAVSLLEFNRTGGVVQSIDVASAGSSALTLSGSSTTEGSLSISPNGQYITLGGYRADAGATNPNGSSAAGNVNRVIGVVPTSTFVADTSRSVSGAASTGNFANDSFRSVVTADGSTFYLSGAAADTTGGVRYYDGVNSPQALNNGATGSPNTRQLQIINGQLFVASGAKNPGPGLFKIGTGSPTSGTQTYTATAPLGVPASSQYQNFFFADLTANDYAGTGVDTVYISDTGSSGLRKYSFDGTNWVSAGAITGAGTITGLAGGVDKATGNVTLFVTTNTASTGILGTVTDSAAASSTLAGTITTLATAGTNYAFRGIVVVPEPATLGALGGVAIVMLRRRK